MCETVIFGWSGERARALNPSSVLSSSAMALTLSFLSSFRITLPLLGVAVFLIVAGVLLSEMCMEMRLMISGAEMELDWDVADGFGGCTTIVESAEGLLDATFAQEGLVFGFSTCWLM